MKLKSKLIATIVSICAAIAVMGVGVWAATDSFTVTVTNQVNIEVANLSGKVVASATATKVGGEEFTAAAFTDVTIFDSESATATLKDEAGTIAVAGEHAWNGTELFTKIDDATTSATLTYTFVYTPYGTPAGFTNVTITPTELPQDVNTNVMSYTYSINGGEAKAFSTAQTLSDAATDPITVTITATYTNAHLVSTIVKGDFAFTVAFATGTAATGTQI